ncbi:hypothetical protein QBC32DRAFT_249566 [Pseudoneurospora amorphoporcata]|uniref:Pentatricopeptide repeat-containing protein n=1 Tax=Pseudoneurospora amorphoporcata TaxID=241081 RepID=A0AAN6SKW2_9PEZI|nr:hypothetical protein QBC32DRAFT_249566 [Pseudoneurospora amorphoporcata]
MRDLGHVCLRCRTQLLVATQAARRPGTPRQPPSQSPSCRPSYSYTTSAPSSVAAQAHQQVGTPAQAQQQPQQQQTAAQHRRDGAWKAPTKGTFNRSHASAHPSDTDGSQLVAMFNDIVHDVPQPSDITISDIDLLALGGRMDAKIKDNNSSCADAFKFFKKEIYPLIKAISAIPTRKVPKPVMRSIRDLLLPRILIEKTRNVHAPELPLTAHITEIMLELDSFDPIYWSPLIIEMIQSVYRINPSPDRYTKINEYESAMARRDLVLFDLAATWKHFTKHRLPWTVVKDLRPAGRSKANAKVQFSEGFSGLERVMHNTLGSHGSSENALHISTWAAFGSYTLLTDPVRCSRLAAKEAGPFLEVMGKILAVVTTLKPTDFDPVARRYPSLYAYIKTQTHLGSFLTGTLNRSARQVHPILQIKATAEQAILKKNLGLLYSAWVQLWGEEDSPNLSQLRSFRENAKIFNKFVYGFMVLRRPKMSAEVWNKMEQAGIKPTIETWTSMLQGAAMSHNVSGIKTIWEKLIASGIQLDSFIWTARISGLINNGAIAEGLKALDQMADKWQNQAKYPKQAVKPSIEPVNAAAVALIRLERDDLAADVLRWAAKQGIHPDIYTFNTLLQRLVRTNKNEETVALLESMKQAKIEPDSATFTILLEKALKGIHKQTPEQISSTVSDVMRTMESSGVMENMMIYAKAIYLLLQEGDRATTAVNAVLAHIWSQGLELTSHIYTMLAEHYFGRDPPDTKAVTALIDNRRLHLNENIDHIFWERVIKGYSRANDPVKAEEIFWRVFNAGITELTMDAMFELLAAMMRHQGMLESAGRLVAALNPIKAAVTPDQVLASRDVEEPAEREARHARMKGERFWKHRFWHLAYKGGLMSDDLLEAFEKAHEDPRDRLGGEDGDE